MKVCAQNFLINKPLFLRMQVIIQNFFFISLRNSSATPFPLEEGDKSLTALCKLGKIFTRRLKKSNFQFRKINKGSQNEICYSNNIFLSSDLSFSQQIEEMEQSSLPFETSKII